MWKGQVGTSRTLTAIVRQPTPRPLSINTHVHTDTPQLRLVLQLSEVEMKFLLAYFIVVPLIIFTVPPPKGTKADAHYQSCKELYEKHPGVLPDRGYYNITPQNKVVKVHCRKNITGCDGVGWTRVANVDANSTKYNCSNSNMTYTEVEGTPMCIRSHPGIKGCYSVNFSTHGIPYSKVCGRARGYQLGFTRAFHSSKYANQGLNDSYVSGLSVTRGEERNHIWTFAAGYSKAYGYATVNCPCAIYPGPDSPDFVGKNYSCESGNPDNVRRQRYMSDPLWDSQGCASGSRCCDNDNPWFTTDLKTDTKESDYIEVRMCRYPRLSPMIEDIGVDLLEIYITED